MHRGVSSYILLILLLFLYQGLSGQAVNGPQNKRIPGVYYEHVDVPGIVGVQIIPPAHFMPFADGVAGWYHQGAAASFSVEIKDGTPYTLVRDGINKESLEEQGAELKAQEDIKTQEGKDGRMYIVTFMTTLESSEYKELEYERILYITGDYNRTIIISANYPVAARATLIKVMIASILTVKF